jgi:methylated-DNA-[protein]-cysteine S-methyltransferase
MAGIGLNLRLGGACFLGDKTGSNAMSQDARRYHVFETAMGFCAIAWGDAGVARFQLPTKNAESAERLMRRRAHGAEPGAPPNDVAAVVEAAKRYFAGEETDFSQVQVDLTGEDAFFAQIYDALRRVGWGRTTTYGALAKEVGAGRERARDVGEAMARNPAPLIIPCHRVLAAGGKIGGFSAPGGSKTKARMLELEGVRLGPPEAAQQAFSF